MRLTIENTNKLIGYKIETPTAEWEVEYIQERKNDYKIGIKFNYGKVHGMRHPKHVLFTLLRYNEFESIRDEWVLMNNWKPTKITLTNGLLQYKMFTGILGGQLDNS